MRFLLALLLLSPLTLSAQTALTQARAEYIGSTSYRWRTSKDARVRYSHKRMEGVEVDWQRPPTLDGMVGHAGCFPRCRCYCEVIV